jgi:endonuclease-8
VQPRCHGGVPSDPVPEGDTIFRAAKTLDLALSGKQVTRFETVLPKLARVDDDSALQGRTVEHVSSRGKHLLISFSGGLVLRTHMRMNGSWHIYRPGERWQKPRMDMRIVVATEDFVAVAFNVGVAEFLASENISRRSAVARLGPDLLADTFDVEEALRRIAADPRAEIADVLLNQRVVSGIGNVYKSEVLFLCGVYPFRKAGELGREVLEKMLSTARKLMLMNVRTGSDRGIVTYTGFRRTTGRSDPSQRLWVYGRGGKSCRKCGTPIQRKKQGLDARSTYWCPTCQS